MPIQLQRLVDMRKGTGIIPLVAPQGTPYDAVTYAGDCPCRCPPCPCQCQCPVPRLIPFDPLVQLEGIKGTRAPNRRCPVAIN